MSEAFHTDELELKRKFNETRLPRINLEARILEKQTTSKRNKPARSRKLLATGCTIVAMVILFGALSSFPASAEQLRKIPLLGKLFEGNILTYVGDSGLINGKNAGLTSAFNQEASDQGVTIKLEDALFDGARLSIATEIYAEQPNYISYVNDVLLTVNGISIPDKVLSLWVQRYSANQSVGMMQLDMNELERYYNLNAGKVEPISFKQLERFDLELQIRKVSGIGEQVNGNWNFKLPVVNNALAKSRFITLETGNMKSSKNGQFELTSYLLTPATTELNIRFSGITDELRFLLEDDRGMKIEMLGATYTTGADGVADGTIRFAPLASGTQTIRVTPYHVLPQELRIGESRLNMDKLPIVLSQGEAGNVIVSNVEFLSDKTLVYFSVEGRDPYLLRSLSLNTYEGRPFETVNFYFSPIRLSDTAYDYVMQYPALDPEQRYVLRTLSMAQIKVLEELAIELKVGK